MNGSRSPVPPNPTGARAPEKRRVRDFLDRTGLWIHAGLATMVLGLAALATIPAPNTVCKIVLVAAGAIGGGAAGWFLHRQEGGALLGGVYLFLLLLAAAVGLMVRVEGGSLFTLGVFGLALAGAIFTLTGGIALGTLIEKAYNKGIHGFE